MKTNGVVEANEIRFKNEIESRGFVGYDHETDVKHLRVILKTRFLASRHYVHTHFPELGDNAWQSVIDKTDDAVKHYVRFYFLHGTPTNYHFEMENPDGMVHLLFDYNICHKENSYFSNGNAGSQYTRYMKVCDYFEDGDNFLDLDHIFHRGPISDNRNYTVWARNAELLVREPVYLDNLVKIVFRTQEAMDRFWSSIDDVRIRRKYKRISVVDESFFCR